MKFCALFIALAASLSAQSPGLELFEKEIRPALVNKCYGCHSTKLKTPMGGLAPPSLWALCDIRTLNSECLPPASCRMPK